MKTDFHKSFDLKQIIYVTSISSSQFPYLLELINQFTDFSRVAPDRNQQECRALRLNV